MNNDTKAQFAERANRQGNTPTLKLQSSSCGPYRVALAVSLFYGGVAAAQGDSPTHLCRFIDQ